MEKKLSQDEAYAAGTDHQFQAEPITLGPWTSYSMVNDPKHMVFTLSRYKFCARMLEGKYWALEVGCGDGFGLPIVAASVKRVYCIDRDPRLIGGNIERLAFLTNVEFHHLDLSESATGIDLFDSAYLIDVIEHLEPEKEERFMRNLLGSLIHDAVVIIGTPNKTANGYASPRSRVQHLNPKSYQDLRSLLKRYFTNGFIFSMNDEVVHTGYYPMAHYLFAVGVGVKEPQR
jgi:2-polyprenyl-3-methyl-5-hydroxy-6-metoxy-1,4-benzoquinol methylase